MPRYMIITAEGYTFSPCCEGPDPDIENCQVLGFEEADSAEEAVDALRRERPWVRDLRFSEVVVFEVGKEEGRFDIGDDTIP